MNHMPQIEELEKEYFQTNRGKEMRQYLDEAARLAQEKQDEASLQNYHYVCGMFAKELEFYISWKITKKNPFDE